MLRFLLFLFNFLVILNLITSSAIAEEKAQVKDIRYYEVSESFRVVVETTGFVEFVKGELKNPERLFFDIKNAFFKQRAKKRSI